MSIFKTAFVAGALVLGISAANAANDVIDNYHGNTQSRPVMSQAARAAFAGQQTMIRQPRAGWQKATNPSSWEELARGAQ